MSRDIMRKCGVCLLAAAMTLLAARPATAQQGSRDPHLAYAFPAGCQQGESCEVVVGGQFLEEAAEAYVVGGGVEVEVLKWYRPMTRGEYNNLRMALDEARMKLEEAGSSKRPTSEEIAEAAGISEDQLREMEIYRQREADPKRQPNEQLAEEVTLKISVAKDAEPGKRELRMLTEASMSNPIWIQVGKWPEVRETEPNDVEPDPVINQLPIVVNGQIMPGDADTFSFEAKKGMRLVIQAAAREVIPYLADAVPGWFQAVMSLSDSNGNEVAYSDSFHYRQDPVLYYEVPRDGKYMVQIHDSIYRGREDFVYRITLGELPFVTSIFPLGARVDSDVKVELEGWNLSQDTLDIKMASRRHYRPVQWYSAPQYDGTVIRFPMQVDRLPEVFDEEPNNDLKTSQSVKTRSIINGRIDYPGDQDIYRLEGFGRLVVDVQARRHGSPLDSILSITDAQGKELAYNDDHEDKSQAFLTHHADSHLEAVIPGTGEYFLHVGDAQRNGGKDFIYRLNLRGPQPDYELRVVPSSIIAHAGAVVPITVFALRNDGFAEDIELSLVDPPPEFRLDGGVIPGNAERTRMTLTVPATPPDGPVLLEMEGHARSGKGSSVMLTRPGVPAENMMQAFIWYHLVPVEDWTVIISGKPRATPPFAIIMPDRRVNLVRGGETFLNVNPLVKNLVAKEMRVELDDAPKGVSAEVVTDNLNRFAVKITTAVEEAEPGLRGNLLLRVLKETTPAPTVENPMPKPRRTDYGLLPAIPFEIAQRKSVR
ncbi:MAG: peptidase [Planctomycetaceae bacterium]|nr:hypothetical protein [Planctomycetales bacterium]MCB9873578.1 peptidase [Planctomycetaceae bacterium]MCB9937085.1 peptidase [Planctomycetaceae bacterium]